MYGNYGNEGGGFGGQRRGFVPVNVGDELTVKIEAVGEKGDGICKKDGFVLFVPGVKEGDEVKIRITKVLRKVGFAEVVSGDSSAGDVPPETTEEEAPVEEEESHAEDTEDFGEEAKEEVEETEAEETEPEAEEEAKEEVEETEPEAEEEAKEEVEETEPEVEEEAKEEVEETEAEETEEEKKKEE